MAHVLRIVNGMKVKDHQIQYLLRNIITLLN